jgi:hypothetical protein
MLIFALVLLAGLFALLGVVVVALVIIVKRGNRPSR